MAQHLSSVKPLGPTWFSFIKDRKSERLFNQQRLFNEKDPHTGHSRTLRAIPAIWVRDLKGDSDI